MTFTSVGQILGMVGTGMVFIGSEILSDVLLKIIDHIKDNIKGLDRQPVPPQLLDYYISRRKISNYFSKIGMSFILIGFLCQYLTQK